MKAMSDKKFYTTTLFENLHSNFFSDIVCKYYDNNEKTSHFWWEQPNNHWKFYGFNVKLISCTQGAGELEGKGPQEIISYEQSIESTQPK